VVYKKNEKNKKYKIDKKYIEFTFKVQEKQSGFTDWIDKVLNGRCTSRID